MGKLRKQQKREASKKQFNAKQSQKGPEQGGRSVSAGRRNRQLVDKVKNARTLDQLVELSRQGIGRDIISQGLQQGIRDRAKRAGLSDSQARNVTQNIVNQQRNVSRLQAQAAQSGSLQSQQVSAQARIKAIQLAKKNEAILKEFEAIRKAEKILSLSNSPNKGKQRQNFQDKRKRLSEQLAANQRQQLRSLNLATSRSRNANIQQQISQRQQQVEQLQFQLRQAQGNAGGKRTADPIASSLAVTPGGNAKVRAIAAKLGQNIQEISRLRQEQQQQQGSQQQQQGQKSSQGFLSSQNVFNIPKPSEKKVDTPLGLSSFTATSQAPAKQTPVKKKDDPLKDAGEGFAAPFFNFGRLIANTPEAIRRDVEQFAKTGKTFDLVNPFDPNSRAKKQLTEGEKFFQKEALEKLQPTVVDSALTGKSTGRSKTFDLFSGLGEAALFAAPFAAPKGTSAVASITSKIKTGSTAKPAPVRPQTQAPTIENIAKGVTQQKKPVTQRRNVPRNVFSQDTAEPSFVKQFVSLGRGTTKTPEGGGAFPTFTFGKPGGKGGRGGTTKPRTFQDPKPKSGDKIIIGKDGLLQVQKTKTKSVTKQQTQSRQFLERQVNLGTGNVKQVSTQKSLLKNPFPKQKTKQKSKAQTKTEEFFRQQSKSAKRRQQDSLFGLVLPRGTQGQKQQQSTRLEIAQPTKQEQRNFPPLLIFKPGQELKQKQSFVHPPILRSPTAQKQSFVPITSTSTITSFLNPTRERTPTRGLVGGGLFFPFIGGGGGSGDPFGRGGRFGRKFLVSNLDPTRAGVISAANVPDLLQGSSERVFAAGDKALAKERKRQGTGNSIGDILSNPFRGLTDSKTSKGKSRKGKSKKKRRKSLLDDPLG